MVDEQARRTSDERSVAEVVAILGGAGVDVWLDGGWCVDALLGAQSRPHGDLDVAVRRQQFDAALAALGAAGFDGLRVDGPHNVVATDAQGRSVDVHAFDHTVIEVGSDGIRRHGGDGLAYEADGFGGAGSIAGTAVRCISPDTLVRYHSGYAVDADDWHDVRLLCERFGLEPPPDDAGFRDTAPS